MSVPTRAPFWGLVCPPGDIPVPHPVAVGRPGPAELPAGSIWISFGRIPIWVGLYPLVLTPGRPEPYISAQDAPQVRVRPRLR
jgi:hypothetical protein